MVHGVSGTREPLPVSHPSILPHFPPFLPSRQNERVSPTPTRSRSSRPDAAAAAAVDLARQAAVDVGGDSVGEHLGVRAEGERVVSHRFAASVPGYSGWQWTVTLARAPRSSTVTVDEVALLPGDSSILAPEWVPWSERVRPEDLGPGDLLPRVEGDPRLVPSYLADDQRQVAFELGLGRAHVLSREGRLDAADRWQAGENGPDTAMARQAPARCGTCGFLVALAGSLQAAFGVCGNGQSPADGRVVSVEFGCGAHSEVDVAMPSPVETVDLVYDDSEVYV